MFGRKMWSSVGIFVVIVLSTHNAIIANGEALPGPAPAPEPLRNPEKMITMTPGSGVRLQLAPNEKSVKKFIGDTYVVSCLNGAVDSEWYTPNGDQVNGTKPSRIRQQPRRGGGGIDLFLQKVTLDDAGTYVCKSKGNNVSFNLMVVKPIAFDNKLAYQTALEGSNYTVKCAAQGQSGVPKMYWKVDHKSPQGPKFKVIKDGLMIYNVTKEDAKRTYVCHAMDIDSPMPDAKLMNIAVHVTRVPSRIIDSETILESWAILGEWANLTCKIDADPIPHFEWMGPAKEKLSSNDHMKIKQDINGSQYISVLQVLMNGDASFGNYTCKAGNDMGSVEIRYHLKKTEKPSTPFLEIDTVSPKDARIRVQRYKPLPGHEEPPSITVTPRDLPIIDYIVESKLAHDSNWYPAKFSTYEQGFVMPGLLPGTTYHIRAALRNAAATGQFSPPIQIITPDNSLTTTTKAPFFDEPERLQPRQKPCPPSLFQCKASKECISYSSKCNGKIECSDASDEDDEMCREALATTVPSSIELLDSVTDASRSISSLAARSALYIPSPSPASSNRRHFFINSPNSLSSGIPPKIKMPSPKDILYATPASSAQSSDIHRYGSPTHHSYDPNSIISDILEAARTPRSDLSDVDRPMQVSATNETSVATTVTDTSRTTKTTNVAQTVSQTVSVKGTTKIITTKKEQIITEKIEIDEL